MPLTIKNPAGVDLSLEIHVYSDGRHPKDMLRSIAHELIHHRQNLEGRLNVGGYHGEGYYLENEELKNLEHEAMLEGNAVMREYEDTLKRKENKEMSLNEWKNNELNRLLMKKFGILKESTKPDYLDLDKDGDKEESMKDAAKEANEGMDYKRDDEGYEKNPEDFTGTRKQVDQNISNLKKGKALQEDSGEEESDHDWHNEHADDNHIREIERHLDALRKDRNYERDRVDESSLTEDSGEEEKRHYEDNAWNDEDHIEAIEKHLRALKKDKDYDEEHEDLEETVSSRKDPRNRKSDENTNLRPMEENNPAGSLEASEEAGDDSDPIDAMLENKIRKVLKRNKKLKLRFK